ncbi:YitT family protein [Leptolinea tardivitalis]|nr:YitT family protein [Leptolinea tardivitalis]
MAEYSPENWIYMQTPSQSGREFLKKVLNALGHEKFTASIIMEYAYLLAGAIIQALAMRLFLVPAQLVSGGISGIGQIVNSFTGWPIGLMVFLGNIPLFLLGWRFLGGPRFALRTALSITVFSFFTDAFMWIIPGEGVTHDLVLNCLYGGVMLGVGLGLVYRGQGTSGGSDILGRILNYRFGISISQSYLMTDTLVVLAGGFAFNWEKALYGLVVIYVSGLAAEMISEGSSVFRTALIISSKPDEVSSKILTDMERGVTILKGTGAYTGADRPVLYVVISRAEVNQVKSLVQEVDPSAFMVISQAHEALGEGFKPLLKR